ncbi:hypothetical protein [Methylobacterium flocculans]|uniref:hypothetical protein n=1 Tax=Methylobacterium flocculans TaxID=2984843 RepID=UPI0021F2F2A1|nr:hypothetical protein [Methylobacterium sp. FF17]
MAEEITLDLAFRVVDRDHRVFIAFPGRNYKLYQTFIAQNVIFPELPGFQLEPDIKLDNQRDLLKMIRRGSALRKWFNSREKGEFPSMDLNKYNDDSSPGRTSQALGVVRGFFDRAKKGDLILVPSGEYVGPVAIGEIQDDNNKIEHRIFPDIYGDHPVPIRNIRWLASQTKSKFSPELIRKFPKPNAFTSVPREFYQEIYSAAFKSYVLEDSFTARFETTEADFSSIDSYYLTQVINSVGALSKLYEESGRESKIVVEFLADLEPNLDSLVNFLTDTTYISDLTVNIASPGFLTAYCQRAVPLVAAALIGLTVLGADVVWNAAQAGTITVKNSHAPDDDFCSPPIGQEVVDQIKMMGFARWKAMCERTNEFRDKTGLNGESKSKK